MIRLQQTFLHRPESGEYGDCFRTALACVLDVDPADLPHEHRKYEDGEQFELMNRALAERGLIAFAVAYPTDLAVDEFLPQMANVAGPNCRFVLGGGTERGINHCVVATSRGVEWDPHPSRAGLSGPDDQGCYTLFLVGKLV